MRGLPALGGDCSRIMASSAEGMRRPASEPAFAPWRWAAPGPASRIPYATFSFKSSRNLQWFSQESRKSSSTFTPVWSLQLSSAKAALSSADTRFSYIFLEKKRDLCSNVSTSMSRPGPISGYLSRVVFLPA